MDNIAPPAESRNPHFIRAVEIIGGYTRLAQMLHLTKANVWNWGSPNRRGVPPEYCIRIEQASGGVVTRYQLRPDVFGPSHEAASAPLTRAQSADEQAAA